MRTRLNTYPAYSIGCAAVWGIILLLGQRRLDSQTWDRLRIMCGGWWVGWTSATIARKGFPPPKPLTPEADRRLRTVSVGLVALGLGSVVHLLVTAKRPQFRAVAAAGYPPLNSRSS